MDFLPPAFEALKPYFQFILYTKLNTKNKVTKIPIDYRTHTTANAHDPAIWMSADEAIAQAKLREGYGVGFVVTKNDPFFFLDIDNALQPDNTWSPLAINLMNAFHGAGMEISQSQRGIHIIGTGECPTHSCKNISHNIELYTESRFIALTGTQAIGNAAHDCTAALEQLVMHYFPSSKSDIAVHDGIDPKWDGIRDDDELIAYMLTRPSASSVFGGKATLKDLWEGNEAVLAKAFPPSGNRLDGLSYDASSADMALALHLAYWTGNDAERMHRLLMRSELRRAKWETRSDYLLLTISGARNKQTEFHNHQRKQPENNSEFSTNKQVSIGVGGFMQIEEQKGYFAGCTYVSDERKVLTPGGYLLSPERFSDTYSGFQFVIDSVNGSVTKDAWEAFVRSRVYRFPRAETTCFRPELSAGEIVKSKDGQNQVNVYWPLNIQKMDGDITPFLNHVSKHFPDENDQKILISYMAAIIQYPGVKFNWCPVIQGVQGNGKTFYTRCLEYAVGIRYCHRPKAAEIGSKFNDWLYRKRLVGIEDIYSPDARLEVMEALKVLITGEYQEIEPKGLEKVTRRICANFIINTNHKDGLRRDPNERRFAIFYTAQQELGHLQRDGLTSDYFVKLYSWAEECGFAIIFNYLHNYQIPDTLNPARDCVRAPITSSTDEAIRIGGGRVEQEIIEAIESAKFGFRNGWISSAALTELLELAKLNKSLSYQKRPAVLKNLGYVPHPGLKAGRLDNPLKGMSSKITLYIREDNPAIRLVGSSDVAKAFENAQAES